MKINLELNNIIDFYLQQNSKINSILQVISLCNVSGFDALSYCLNKKNNKNFTADELKLIRMNAGNFFVLRIPLQESFIKQAIVLKPDLVILYDNFDSKNNICEPFQDIELEALEDTILNLEANNVPIGIFLEPDNNILKKIHKTNLDWIEIDASSFTEAEDSNDEFTALENLISFLEVSQKMGFGSSLRGNISLNLIPVLKKLETLDEICLDWDFWDLAIKLGIEKAAQQVMMKFLR